MAYTHQATLDLAPRAVVPEPVETSPDVLDLGPVVDAIMASTGGEVRHGVLQGDAHDHATRRLDDWHGGIVHREDVVLGRVGGCAATAELARTGRGLWLADSHSRYGVSMECWGRLSVWHRTAYATRDQAIRAEGTDLAARFAAYAANPSSEISAKDRREMTRMAVRLGTIGHETHGAGHDMAVFDGTP